MKTKIIEAVQSKAVPGNWGKFMVMAPEEEWAYRSQVSTEFGGPLLSALGWSAEHVWVLDLQTGEGAFFRPGGLAHADLNKHRVWVCPLFEPFLEWLYARYREDPRLDISSLPDVVELPDAEFAFAGYRRPGPGGRLSMEPRPALSGEAKGRPGLPGTTVRRSSFDAAGMSLAGRKEMTMENDSVSHGMYQCPRCHGPSGGPGECRICLARPRDYSQFIGQPVSAEQVAAYLARTYGSHGPVEITDQEFPLRPPSPQVQAYLDDAEAMEAAMRDAGAADACHSPGRAVDLGFMPLPDMTPAQLLAGAAEVASRFPAAVLIKNDVGNLAILAGGEYAGYLDLRTGEVCT